jgi:hypothetical protein
MENAFLGMEVGVALFFLGVGLNVVGVAYVAYLKSLKKPPRLSARQGSAEGDLSSQRTQVRRLHSGGIVIIAVAFLVASIPYLAARFSCP